MKINEIRFHSERKKEVLIELQDLLSQPWDRQRRPCPSCRIQFGSESTLSAAHCSSDCRFAPRFMSSDPEKYPIESGVVPLVYALYRMRLMEPCWSCEGHLEATKQIWKMPKVWFYSASHFYPKLVAQLISELQGKHKISNSRGVRILPFSQSMYDTTYSIKPQAGDQSLARLHADIKVISKTLRLDMLSLARGYTRRQSKVKK